MPFICDVEQVVTLIKDITLAITPGIGAWIAFKGLSTWNRQLKGGVEYELARRLLKSTYALREAIKSVRHPMMWAAEMPLPPEEERKSMTSEYARFWGQAKAYELRWEKVTAARDAVQADLLEGEALWGQEIHDKYMPLFQLQQELYSYINVSLLKSNPKTSESMQKRYYKTLESKRDVMFDLSMESDDEYSMDISNTIQTIEKLLKPHLKK